MYGNLSSCGSFSKPKKNENEINETAEVNVLAYVMQIPSMSTRQIAVEAGVSQRTVVLKKNKFHPYKKWFALNNLTHDNITWYIIETMTLNYDWNIRKIIFVIQLTDPYIKAYTK